MVRLLILLCTLFLAGCGARVAQQAASAQPTAALITWVGPFGPITVEADGQKSTYPFASAGWTDTAAVNEQLRGTLPEPQLSVPTGGPVVVHFGHDLENPGGYRGPANVELSATAAPAAKAVQNPKSPYGYVACHASPTALPIVRSGQQATITAALAPGDYVVCLWVSVDASAANPVPKDAIAKIGGSAGYLIRLIVR